MTYTRPDICYATKELARALQQPTSADQPAEAQTPPTLHQRNNTLQSDHQTSSQTEGSNIRSQRLYRQRLGRMRGTRESTTGFTITVLGATLAYGSRTKATIALSGAQAEPYAINAGSKEALHSQYLPTDLLNNNEANVKIHTDSASGKSIATRIRTGKKAKHVELKHILIQQLVALCHLRIIKTHMNNNPADIFTKCPSAEILQRHLHSV